MIPTLTQEPCAEQQDVITIFIDNFGDHPADQVRDVAAIEKDCDLPNDFIDDGSVGTNFRICVYKEYIWSRRQALYSILDGLWSRRQALYSILDGLKLLGKSFCSSVLFNCQLALIPYSILFF
jgi:hypothetical protein